MEIFASRKTFLKLAGKIAVALLVFFFQREKVMGKGKLALIKVVGTMDIFSKKHEGAERHEKVLGKWRCSKFSSMDFGVSTAFL